MIGVHFVFSTVEVCERTCHNRWSNY